VPEIPDGNVNVVVAVELAPPAMLGTLRLPRESPVFPVALVVSKNCVYEVTDAPLPVLLATSVTCSVPPATYGPELTTETLVSETLDDCAMETTELMQIKSDRMMTRVRRSIRFLHHNSSKIEKKTLACSIFPTPVLKWFRTPAALLTAKSSSRKTD